MLWGKGFLLPLDAGGKAGASNDTGRRKREKLTKKSKSIVTRRVCSSIPKKYTHLKAKS